MAPVRRLVRRRPLKERIQAFLNPMDFYLYLSEEIQTFDWDSTIFGTRFGLIANFLFLLARANVGSRSESRDDVFSDAPANGPLAIFAHSLMWILMFISGLNAFSTMTRTRTYRLFEANVETTGPATPSAHRVRVDSSPASSTPLRVLQGFLSSETAEQRAHPDKTRDVWEMKVWDPYPATLRTFCLFSPGHVLIYMLFLPLQPLDPRPSVTVFKCLALQVILSVQLLFMHSRFSQQAKDTAIIQKEVMHEYDVKFVHPRLQPVYREVGTQVSITDDTIEQENVSLGTPASVIRRSFKVNPNPNYARHYDPDGVQRNAPRAAMTPLANSRVSRNPFTPVAAPAFRPSTPSYASQTPSANSSFAEQLHFRNHQSQSALRRSMPATASAGTGPSPNESFEASTPSYSRAISPAKGTPMRASSGTNPLAMPPSAAGLGGSMGLYTHKDSPLKKAMSTEGISHSPRNNREMAALEQRQLADRMRERSPIKHQDSSRRTISGSATGSQFDASSFAHSPDKLEILRANRWKQERFPTRRL